MKEGMVHSQMAALEEPDEVEEWDALTVDVRGSKEEVMRMALSVVRRKLEEYEDVGRRKENGKVVTAKGLETEGVAKQ